MEFDTYWPLILLPLPLFVYYFFTPITTERTALRVPFLPTIKAIAQDSTTRSPQRLTLTLLTVAWLALLIACSRPIHYGEPMELPNSARDMLLAVDISGSMDERDMQISGHALMRIDVVKQVLSQFIEQRAGDRLGLILFADNAYLQAPLTYDTDAVNTLLQEAQLGFAGQQLSLIHISEPTRR